MHDRRPSIRFAILFVGMAAALAACSEAGDPVALAPDGPRFASSGPVLVECPVDSGIAATGTVDALGGAVRLQNHELALPLLAVVTPTQFRVAAPASRFMELAIGANGGDSFEFERAVSITIDYSRCPRSNIDKAPLTVWQIDPETKELLEPMGGVDDKVSRTITFQSDHLSHFSIAQ